MTNSSKKEQLTLNISPVQFEDAEVRIGIFEYLEDDKSQLQKLRAAYGNTHVFLRDGERVLCVPFTAEASDVGEQFEPIQLKSNLRLCAALLRNALLNFLHSLGRPIYKHRPLLFVAGTAKNNLLAQSLPPQFQCPDWLGIYPQYEADIRVFYFDKRAPFVGVALNIRTTRRIDLPCSELLTQGFSFLGLYVGDLAANRDPRLEPYLHLIGRVDKVDEGLLLLTDTRDDVTSIAADHARLQRSQDAFNRCLDFVFKEEAEQVKTQVEQQLIDIRIGPTRLEKLRQVVQYLADVHLEIVPGVAVNLLPYLSSEDRNFPSLETAPRPVYVFDPTGAHTDTWHDRGLGRYGPYTAQTFDKNKPRICVVCQATSKGRVDQFLRKFFHGIRIPKKNANARAPYEQGFIRKYMLEDITFEFFSASNDTPAAYKRAVEAAIEWQQDRNIRWDLALVQIEDRFHDLHGEENPYLVAKAGFLTHQVPVQEFTIETTALPDSRLGYALNNMALASYAKLGGIPWLIKASPTVTHELVIGLGSANIGEGRLGKRERIVGITTVFSGDGNYWLSNLTRSVPLEEYQEALLNCLRRTVTRVQQNMNWQPHDHVRLIFHAFKPFKDTEAQAVKNLMAELGDYDVDYAFIHVIDDHPYFLFDRAQPGDIDYETRARKGVFAPSRGGYLRLSRDEVLLILTGPKEVKRAADGLPHPVLMRLHPESTFEDTTYLARQAFSFSCHSWRSFFPASFPVTILYSELIANLLGRLDRIPRWNPDVLIDRIERTRWFL